jgi:RNA polymerase sigma-70 factor, ECF subfamily
VEEADCLDDRNATPDLRMTCAEVMNAIAHLGNDHREVLLLAGPGEMTCSEIARLLNIPLGTVLSRLSRARQRLREMLGWDGLVGDLSAA